MRRGLSGDSDLLRSDGNTWLARSEAHSSGTPRADRDAFAHSRCDAFAGSDADTNGRADFDSNSGTYSRADSHADPVCQPH